MLKRTCLLLALVYSVSIASAQKPALATAVNKITTSYLAVKNSLALTMQLLPPAMQKNCSIHYQPNREKPLNLISKNY